MNVSGRVSIFAFASLAGVPAEITSPAVWLKIYELTVSIKKFKSVIKKKKKRNDKIVLLAKTKLNTIKVLISKTLINPYINHDEFVSVNNVLIECNEMKEIKNPETSGEYTV